MIHYGKYDSSSELTLLELHDILDQFAKWEKEDHNLLPLKILEIVDLDSDTIVIKDAWRKKQRRYHPDNSTNQQLKELLEEITKYINKAYDEIQEAIKYARKPRNQQNNTENEPSVSSTEVNTENDVPTPKNKTIRDIFNYIYKYYEEHFYIINPITDNAVAIENKILEFIFDYEEHYCDTRNLSLSENLKKEVQKYNSIISSVESELSHIVIYLLKNYDVLLKTHTTNITGKNGEYLYNVYLIAFKTYENELKSQVSKAYNQLLLAISEEYSVDVDSLRGLSINEILKSFAKSGKQK